MSGDLCTRTIEDLAPDLREGRVSPLDVTSEALERIREHDDDLVLKSRPEGLGVILDTNAVSAITGGDESIGELVIGSSALALPVHVVAEYLFGLLGSNHKQTLLRKFLELERSCESLAADRTTAEFYAEIRHDLKRRGRPIPDNDIWIAALARQHGLAVVSLDTHFDAVDSITRIGW